jgi:hypothetical protein
MSKRKRSESRSEIRDNVDKSKKDLEQQTDDLETKLGEVDAVRDTIANLDFGGTLEGGTDLEQTTKETEETAVEVFDGEDQKLERFKADNEALEANLSESKEADESDQIKLENVGRRIEAKRTLGDLIEAQQAVISDLKILTDNIARAKEARDRAVEEQKGMKNRVHGNGGKQS